MRSAELVRRARGRRAVTTEHLIGADGDWAWENIRDVAIDTLLVTVHDLGAPTQARVDAASALLAAAQARMNPQPEEGRS